MVVTVQAAGAVSLLKVSSWLSFCVSFFQRTKHSLSKFAFFMLVLQKNKALSE